MIISNVHNILITRLSALGDIIFTTSLLDTLRIAYPETRISWLAQSTFAGIIQDDPRLDEVIVVRKQDLSSLPKLVALRRQLRSKQFDLVIDAQGTLKSNLVSSLAGSRRVGFAAKRVGKVLLRESIPKGGDIRDISSEYRFLGQTLTGTTAAAPNLVVASERRERVNQQMAQKGVMPGFVALSPFTTRPEKHWIAEHWSMLADLANRDGKQCVIFGGPGREAEAEQMVRAAAAPVINLTGQTALADLPAWFSMADRVIGVDTGLTHLGIAVKRPVVVLFGATCPYTQGAESPLKVLYDPPRPGQQGNMNGLTPEVVWQEAATMREMIE